MHVGEYILALVAIVLGLAITDLAFSTHRLIRRRADVKLDPIAILAALLSAYFVFVNFWGDYHHFQNVTSASLWGTLPNLAILFLNFLVASVALPDEWTGKIDLWEYYLSIRREFWSLVGLTTIIAFIYDVVTSWPQREPLIIYPLTALSLAVFVTLFVSRRRWIHSVLVPAWFAYVVLGFGNMVIRG